MATEHTCVLPFFSWSSDRTTLRLEFHWPFRQLLETLTATSGWNRTVVAEVEYNMGITVSDDDG